MPINIKGLEHVGIVVDNFEEARALLQETFSLEPDGGVTLDGRRTAFFTPGAGARIEIIEVSDPEMRRKRLGHEVARIEHLAFEVDDLDATIEALSKLGVHFVEPPRDSGDFRTTWTVPATTDGVMFQLSERSQSPEA
jgi:catechol 2,3-dioxygenase-like lactoylglutathione lyase family enzyme